MQIAINEKNEIIGYAKVGKITGGFDFNADIPADFAPKKYILDTEETEEGNIYNIILNPDYSEPVPDTEPPTNAELAAAIAELAMVMMGGA